nr:PTS sugar transporter subunit IIC [Lactococcus garvieae]
MQNFMNKLTMQSVKIQNNKYLSSVTGALIALIGIIIVGAIFSIFTALPIPAYQEFLTAHDLKTYLSIPVNVTTNVLSLYLVFVTSYIFMKKSDREEGLEVGLLALMAFLIITPFEMDKTFNVTAFSPTWFGPLGMFTSFIVALGTATICLKLYEKNIVIKMPAGVPEMVSKSFGALIPGFIVTFVALAIRIVFAYTPFHSFHEVIYGLLAIPLTKVGTSPIAGLLFVILIQFFWFFGVHGTLLVGSIIAPILMPLDMANLAAYHAGKPVPNLMTATFLMQSFHGVAGLTIGLTLLMCFFAKSKQYKTIGKLGILPNIFGINEPIVFGTPIVLNFQLLIPFVLTPVIGFISAYVFTIIGILPQVTGVIIPTGVPFGFAGLMIGGWRWAIFQVLEVILSIAIYYPFFKRMDKEAYLLEQEAEKN